MPSTLSPFPTHLRHIIFPTLWRTIYLTFSPTHHAFLRLLICLTQNTAVTMGKVPVFYSSHFPSPVSGPWQLFNILWSELNITETEGCQSKLNLMQSHISFFSGFLFSYHYFLCSRYSVSHGFSSFLSTFLLSSFKYLESCALALSSRSGNSSTGHFLGQRNLLVFCQQ